MEIGEIHIIDKSEESTMTGSWTEYLCLRKVSVEIFELSVRGYMILDEIEKYYDEETDVYSYPDEIDGWSVMGTEGVYIIGHNLINQSDNVSPIEFTSVDDPEVIGWLSSPKKYDDKIINDIRSHIKQS
jgi:hypothetical protein